MFYVYEHIRKDTNIPFYVGKGKGYRANSTQNRNIYWKRVVEKAGYTINYVAKGIDEELAYLCEQERIDQLKRLGCKLANLTVGGEGAGAGELHHMWGKPHPQKGTKRPWLRERYLGENNPRWGKPSAMRGKNNIGASLALKGRKRPEGGGKPSKQVLFTDKHGNNVLYQSIAEAEKAQNVNRSTIRKCMNGKCISRIGDWNYADIKIAQQFLDMKQVLKNMPNPNLGRKASDKTKAKMSLSRTGRKQSDEERKMRSEAIKLWHQNRKEKLCPQ